MSARTIVVTGGGTGIGRAVAGAFAADGDTVVVTGRRRERLEQAVAEIGPGARAVDFDASDPAAVGTALERLPTTVDVLVNAAGGNTDLDRPAPRDTDLDGVAAAWRANFDANVLTAVLVTSALTPRIAEGGRIVTIGSIAARRGAGGYGAAKAAVEAWNASLATDVGPRAITANVVSPGLTTGTEFFRGRLGDERRRRLVDETKNRREGTTDDVGAAVAYLASPHAGHVTGQVLHVNGGAYLGH
ncbi:3-oxoacyl-[acyl-carrier protein] reductase [Haloactinopolyspora alba]|uniref:3-oxoacyl-[acyl-carrier protein] reductase n=1 Tax=Haloactinopolyspora alba TaxID=648780 RepID=A0A2P8DVG4_9ACTN|nr:SDR family oxidoreductase [Haloactinopolyspora alba]PSL01167.1 3-oxoacyl-[acyl-carrier protein] reductase [Haloactinopolyspora alba]